MALIRIVVSLILWFPAAALVLWVVAYFLDWITFYWFWVFVIALITALIFEYLTGPKE